MDSAAQDLGISNGEKDMQALRAKAQSAMESLNKSHPGAGGQAYVRREDGVHTFDNTGNINPKPATLNPKTNQYEN